MRIQWGRGLFRLWIVVSVIWISIMAFVIQPENPFKREVTLKAEVSDGREIAVTYPFSITLDQIKMSLEKLDYEFENINQSSSKIKALISARERRIYARWRSFITSALFLPVLLLGIWFIGRWIYAGFR